MDFPNHEIDFHRHMSCSFMFNELRGNAIGCFDDMGGSFLPAVSISINLNIMVIIKQANMMGLCM
jgi:hypothetical protein